MTDGPLVSVVTAFYNPGKFLQEAIESVVAQSYKNWEYWLVDDGSSDESTTLAQHAATTDQRIHYLEHPGHENRGMCTSRNAGLALARGKYVAILDGDDVWFPDKLREQVEIAEANPTAGVVFGRSRYWRDWPGSNVEGVTDVPRLAPGDRLYHAPELARMSYQWGSPCPSDLLMRIEVLQQIGGFEESFDRFAGLYEDQALLAKLYLNVDVYVSNRCWDLYRIHADSCCAVAARTGLLDQTRQKYFEWLGEYLSSRQVCDAGIWKSWRRQTFRYRRPLLYAAIGVARKVKRALRRFSPHVGR